MTYLTENAVDIQEEKGINFEHLDISRVAIINEIQNNLNSAKSSLDNADEYVRRANGINGV